MPAVAERPTYKPELRGELQECFHDLMAYKGPTTVKEILIEGPRGSGKSRPTIFLLHGLCANYPGTKVIVVRKTRHSLSESFCKTYEEDVLTPKWRQKICGDADRTNRSHYQYENGSRIVLVGLDKPSKHQSTDWDVVFIEEASEVTWKQVEPFAGALRQFTPGLPWQLLLVLTNPDARRHWTNQRAVKGLSRRVRTHHKDNPKWFNEDGTAKPEGAAFMASLRSRYTGVSYLRHVDGVWASAKGAVWENFDPEVHIIDQPKDIARGLGIVEYRAAVDWGSTAPGVLGVWGIDGDKRLIEIAEIYQPGKTPDWWAAQAVALVQEFRISKIVCDPSRPDMIDLFNDWLLKAGLSRIAYAANNKKASSGEGDMSGLALVRWGLERDATGIPRIRWLRNAPRGNADPGLVAVSAPICTVDEIPSYVHDRDTTGEFVLERTNPRCADHGCDQTRYMAADNWAKEPERPRENARAFAVGSDAWHFGTPESLERARLARERLEEDGE